MVERTGVLDLSGVVVPEKFKYAVPDRPTLNSLAIAPADAARVKVIAISGCSLSADDVTDLERFCQRFSELKWVDVSQNYLGGELFCKFVGDLLRRGVSVSVRDTTAFLRDARTFVASLECEWIRLLEWVPKDWQDKGVLLSLIHI